jgi:hypothetical protein
VRPEDAGDDGIVDLDTIAEGPKVNIAGSAVARRTSAVSPSEKFPKPFSGVVFVSEDGRGMGISPMAVTRRDPVVGQRHVERMSSEGDFAFEFLWPNIFVLELDGIPAGWHLESARTGARDVLRDGVDAGAGRYVGPLEIALADVGARLDGAVRDVFGNLVPGARLILIPHATQRGSMTRFHQESADSTGAYRFEDIRPGVYGLLAMDLAGRPDLVPEDPAFLAKYGERAVSVSLDRGARLTINAEAIPLVD